jgi:hypothetical protein
LSSISGIGNPAAAVQLLSTAAPTKRAADGDTPAQEAAETNTAKRAEKSNGGFAPKGVNKIA